MSLIIGRTYIIKDCRGDKKEPSWMHDMDKYIGQEIVIQKSDLKFPSITRFGWNWAERWLKLKNNYDKLLNR